MQNAIESQKPVRFQRPLTFKALKERGCGLAALLAYNTGYVAWNLPRWVRGFRVRVGGVRCRGNCKGERTMRASRGGSRGACLQERNYMVA